MQAEEGVLQDENDSPHNDLNVRKTRLKMNFSTNREHQAWISGEKISKSELDTKF